jgi:hypothetical protein
MDYGHLIQGDNSIMQKGAAYLLLLEAADREESTASFYS